MFCTTECWDCEDYKCKYALQKEYSDKLKERIDKAIVYIQSNLDDIDDNTCENIERDVLLNILKGSDKE